MNGTTRASATQPTTAPTSPWTEAFQAASQHQTDACMPTAMSSEDDESQRPTHDALSDIYNREV